MAKQDILALLFSLVRVLLEVDQVLDVNELAEGILLDFFLSLI